MNPFRFLTLIALTALLGLPSLRAAEKNIIFYITDDMSQELGCYGNKIIQTPNMDALAKDGCLFTNAYATVASCSPSRSVIMTGLHNHANGQYGLQHDYHNFACYPSVYPLALPQVIKQAGYRTALIGKHHVAPEAVFHYDFMPKEAGRNTVAMVDAAREVIFAKDDKPFFIYFGAHDPHRDAKTLDVPGKPNSFGNKPDHASYPGVKEVFYEPKDVTVPVFLPDTAETRAELAQYYQSVSRVDFGLGHLIAMLKEAGVYDKTLIIVTSDHGMAFPGAKTTVYEPGLRVPMIVRNPYVSKRGIKNTALISHVDITPTLLDFAGGLDVEKNAPKERLNVAAFFKQMNLSRVDNHGPVFDHYHGHSWLNLMDKEEDPTRTTLFASHTFHEVQMYYPMRAVREGDFKLIWNIAHPLAFPSAQDIWVGSAWQAQWQKGKDAPWGLKTVDQYMHRPQFELYDLKYDPDETKNLANDPAHAKTLEALKAKLKQFQIEMNDPWVMKWDHE